MSQNINKPKQYDAVLGNQAQAPVDGIVLGGIEGIKRRLLTTDPKTQIAALCETLKYGEAVLDLVIQASKSTETQVQLAAEKILIQQRNIPEFKQKLLEYNPWLFFDCLLTLNEHSDRVTCVAVDASGLTLASGSNDKTIKIRSLPTGELQRTLERHSAKVNSILFTPNGELVSCSKDATIKVWDLTTGKVIQNIETDINKHRVATKYDKMHITIALSSDETTICCVTDHNPNIEVWNLDTGSEIYTLEGHSDGKNEQAGALAISADAKKYAHLLVI